MDWILGTFARALVALLQALPLDLVARIGRALGAVAWVLDRRHRRVALENVGAALGAELGPEGVRRVARENLLRIGENYLCAVKTAAMDDAALADRLAWVGFEGSIPSDGSSLVAAIGHFGNFELFARARRLAPGWTVATTYRALRQPGLNRVMQGLREASGVRYFERTREGAALREALGQGQLILGLLADQHAGDRGLWLPFFGRPCSTTASPAVYALRYGTPLVTAVCYRVGLARWAIEFSGRIETRRPDGAARETGEIMADVNRALEAAVRRDPANWFWVHRRWKRPSRHQLRGTPDRDGEGTSSAPVSGA